MDSSVHHLVAMPPMSPPRTSDNLISLSDTTPPVHRNKARTPCLQIFLAQLNMLQCLRTPRVVILAWAEASYITSHIIPWQILGREASQARTPSLDMLIMNRGSLLEEVAICSQVATYFFSW